MFYGISFSALPCCSMFGRFRQTHGWDHSGRTSYNHRLVFVIGGQADFRVQGRRFRLVTGDWLLIPCGVNYGAYTDDYCEYYFFHFEDELERLETPPPAAAAKQRDYSIRPAPRGTDRVWLADHMASGENMTDLLRLCGEMNRLILCGGDGERLLFDLYFGQIIALLSIAARGAMGTEPSPLMKSAVEYIQEHYTSPITLTELTEQLHVSKSYLIRLFRQHLGMTVTAYINGVKLDYAAQLLTTSSMNVQQTADCLGYADSGYFARLFRRRFGVSPSRFARDGMKA